MKFSSGGNDKPAAFYLTYRPCLVYSIKREANNPESLPGFIFFLVFYRLFNRAGTGGTSGGRRIRKPF
jgi:hypothetical protein